MSDFIAPTSNNHVSVAGNLTRDPQVFTSEGGKPRTVFTIAVNDERDRTNDKLTAYVDVTAFGRLGENVVTSLKKGVRVVVSGRLNSYVKAVTDSAGKELKFTIVSINADFVGPDLTFASAQVTGNERASNGAAQSSVQQPAAQPAMASAGAGSDEKFQF